VQRAACCGNDLSFEKVALQEEICGCKRTVKCCNWPTMSSVTFTIDNETREQIDNLARVTRKLKETVLREVVETGLKSYQTTPTKGIKALLDLAEWAEEHNVTHELRNEVIAGSERARKCASL
jgi:predicted transcriptional regulator